MLCPLSLSVNGLDREGRKVKAGKRKWKVGRGRSADRSECGTESYIKVSEKLLGEIVSAQQMKEDVEQTQGEQRQ